MRKNNLKPKGFTLVELIVVIGLFGFLSALLMQNMFMVYHFKKVISFQKEINYEASSVLNNGIAGLIRNGFAIHYEKTVDSKSNGMAEGFAPEVDQISIFTDRAETQYFTIYREPYVSSGVNGDTARLLIAFSTGEEFPLTSSEVVIEDFDIVVPKNPRADGDIAVQPYVGLYLKARHRYPFGEPTDEANLDAYQKVRASYKTTFALRNTLPSSYKN